MDSDPADGAHHDNDVNELGGKSEGSEKRNIETKGRLLSQERRDSPNSPDSPNNPDSPDSPDKGEYMILLNILEKRSVPVCMCLYLYIYIIRTF